VISVPYPPVEGIGIYVHNLSKIMVEKGHKVTIITRNLWNKTQREVIDNVEVIRAQFIPIYPFYIHVHGLYVNKVFRTLEPNVDIVHIHSPLSPLIKTTLPVLLTIHSPMLTDFRHTKITSFYSLFSKVSARYISYPLELKHIKASNMVTTVSKSVAEELVEYGLNPEEVAIIGNGVDESFFNFNRYKPENGKNYVMYAGRIDREKGLFDLLKCGEYLCKERSDVFFIIAGEGRDLHILKQKTKELNLQDKFIFLGQIGRDQIVKWYHKAKIFILPSYHEGLPTVLLEAMSCGLPVIATNVRGNRDLISTGENGILVPAHSPKKMAEAISSLIDDEVLRNDIGTNARNTIEKKYTWDIISKKILECYESLIGV
jgi:glycosyltransferase involved in cell wall biosynthesis